VSLPSFTESGDLPEGVHAASLRETLARFGAGGTRRKAVALRLERIYHTAQATGHLSRFVVFGSFVTDAPEPNDVDVFLLMDDGFDASELTGEARLLFDHPAAQAHFGASVFWLRRLSAFPNEEDLIANSQIRRDRQLRGIVEIVGGLP